MGIISGLGSFRGLFGDHFRVGDHFGVGIISGAVQGSFCFQALSHDLSAVYKMECKVKQHSYPVTFSLQMSQISQRN